MEQSTVNLMQQRFIATGRAIDVSDFKELCFRITEIFISERSECKSAVSSISLQPISEETQKFIEIAARPKLSTAEIKRKLPIRFSYDEVTLALTELVRIRALDEHVVKGKLFYSRR